MLQRYICGIKGCQSSFIRKGYLKHHLINIHNFTLRKARQYILYSERGCTNSFKEMIEVFNVNLFDECRHDINTYDVVSVQIEIDNEKQKSDVYTRSEIKSGEFVFDDNDIGIGPDSDVSTMC
jgi:hypothetical protein